MGDKKCPPAPYTVIPEECTFVDQQRLKLQEAPETVPTGEMPRHMLCVVDRALVGRVVPGTRVNLVGTFGVAATEGGGGRGGGRGGSGAGSVQKPYIRVLGLEQEQHGTGRVNMRFSPAEEDAYVRFSKRPDAYDIICRSIGPALFGLSDVKAAVGVLLFGGTRKNLPDGLHLRGDVNVLMVGDAGCGKSQLLKFVEKVAPICVYTSGKGSSAAGLTASVIRDKQSREFYLEGGAMVLADGGVVCIDEFDKMRDQDRVAIHEAMEQQTISIAKAGITTVLNSRTAVLGAANPTSGRYDSLKNAAEQMEFQSTILSRFDMIFIIKDTRNMARDEAMARHVVGLHMSGTGTSGPRGSMGPPSTKRAKRGDMGALGGAGTTAVGGSALGRGDGGGSSQAFVGSNGLIDIDRLKRYIAYARSRCAPILSDDAAAALQSHYVSIRGSVRARELSGKATIPITIRQREAIVRISEALAKMTLSPYATKSHVEEAIRLFKVSTLEAATSGQAGNEVMSPEVQAETEQIEAKVRARVPIGHSISERIMVQDLERQGYEPPSIARALAALLHRGELEHRKKRKMLHRKR